MSAKYLNTFFKEKEIPFEEWYIRDNSGCLNFINNEVIIEFIKNDKQNHKAYADTIRKIDFQNGNINHYLKYLAKGIVNL